jgi:AraC-like DNA-binding protein
MQQPGELRRDHMEIYYTVKETAEIFRCSPQTISRRINEGIIPTHADDKGIIPKQYVEDWAIDHNKETFKERKLRLKNDQLLQEVQDLKTIIKSMVRIGMEIDL